MPKIKNVIKKSKNKQKMNKEPLPTRDAEGYAVVTLNHASRMLDVHIQKLERIFKHEWCKVPYTEIDYHRFYRFADIIEYLDTHGNLAHLRWAERE